MGAEAGVEGGGRTHVVYALAEILRPTRGVGGGALLPQEWLLVANRSVVFRQSGLAYNSLCLAIFGTLKLPFFCIRHCQLSFLTPLSLP